MFTIKGAQNGSVSWLTLLVEKKFEALKSVISLTLLTDAKRAEEVCPQPVEMLNRNRKSSMSNYLV